MTTALPIEELLRQVLDRLARHERRTDAIETALARLGAASPRTSLASSSSETPPEIPWPRREVRDSPAVADRVRELEARLAEAEERLRIAARLETVGRLVAGVSHDFNNLLTIISGHAEALRNELPDDRRLREIAELIATTAHTAAGVTRQLVDFGKPARLDPGPVDVNVAVRALERTLGRLASGRVTLSVTLAPGLPLIRTDPAQFDQVLLNLVVNARDAIRETGIITVRTAAAAIAAGRAGWPAEVPPGDFVVLTVTDTGMGMTDEVKARIFDLFFTTKGVRGNGVGLSTVKEIVTAAGGHIEVESSPGWGTHVRVYWPIYPESSANLRVMRSHF